MTHPLTVITKALPKTFLRETLHKPWMRLQVFIDEGPLSRTPEYYKKFLYEWKVERPTPVHYIPETGKWKRLENGVVLPVQNFHLPLKYPLQMHQGIWGGEAVIKGFEKRKPKRTSVARYWVPAIHKTVVYSEILDRYMSVMITPRALDLIDEHYGLDSYLMKTRSCDLMSELALKLKKEMLYALLHKTLYPDNPEKREEIYNKYKEFIIPEEELEWFALTLREAYRKQKKLEEKEAFIGPYKHIFRKEFIDYLKANKQELEDEPSSSLKTSIMDKLGSISVFRKST